MKKSLIFLFGFFAFFIVTILSSQHTYAEVSGTDSVINGLITQQQLNQTQKPQFSDHHNSSEAIDPVTGSLSWKQNNIHLSGREGLDLNIGILYQSNLSFKYMEAYNVPGNLKKYNYTQFRYDLGVGWSFRFPSVQLIDGYIYYHSGEGSVYRVDFNATGSAESYTHLIGYQGKDLHFVKDAVGTFSNGLASSAYYLEYASKKREYFADDGRLLGIVDRFGNKITFQHQDRQMYDNQPYKVISSITDTVGRTITFTYDTNLQTAADADFNGENIVVAVKDPSGNAVQSITYTKGRVQNTYNGSPDGYVPILWRTTDQTQENTYINYVVDNQSFDYSKKSFDSNSGLNSFLLLSSVKSPNSQTNYQYEKTTRNLGASGVGEEYRILNRNDQLWKYDTTQSQWSLVGDYNHENYTYSGDYTGYPTYDDQSMLPSNYTFSSTATLQSSTATNGLKTTSTFNGDGQPLSTETQASNGERKVSTNLAFDSTFNYLPISIQFADFAVGDTDTTANKLFINKQYTNWGGLQSETSPLTQAQLNDAATNSKYTTTYMYEPTYYQLQSQSWFQNLSDAGALSESYSYDGNGRITSSSNAKGEVTNICYDIIDLNNNVTSSCSGGTPPLLGMVQKITSTKNLNNGKTAKTVTMFGADTSYSYPNEIDTYFDTTDANNQPITQTEKKAMTYDMGTGLLKDTINGNNNKTTYSYDALGRATEIKYPTFTNLNGEQYDVADVYDFGDNYISTAYDATNSGISSEQVHSYRKYTQKSNSVETKLNELYELYDGLGNLRFNEFYDPKAESWKHSQYHYDDVARANYEIDPMQNTTTASYDEWGTQSEVSDVYGNLYKTEQNLKSRRSIHYMVAAADVSSYRSNPNQSSLKSNYIEQDLDQWGNVITNRAYKNLSQTQPITESYAYNILGQVVAYTDQKKNMNNEGVTNKYSYDALNRLVTLKDALNQLTNYQYDYTGEIQQVSMQGSPTDTPVILNTKQYNEVGGLKQKTDPANQNETYTYNNLGLINQQVDRNGTVFTSQYDEQNRVKVSSASYNGTTMSSNSIIGSSGIMTDTLEAYVNGTKTGSMQTGMDSLKRVTSITSSITNYSSSLGLSYDSNSRLIKQSNNLSAFDVNYHYDRQRMDQVQMDGQAAVNTAASANATYDYYANGQVKTITYPTLADSSILKTASSYDTLNRLVNVTNTKGATTLSAYAYSYDDNGNIISKTETVNQASKTTSYTYDGLDRLLTKSRSDGSTATYTYDLRGNRLTLQDNSLNSTMNNSITDTSNTYDLLDRLTSVTKGTVTTTFAYAPNNLRYKMNSGTQTVQYQYDAAGQVISESDGNNTVTANYVRGDRLLEKKDAGTGKAYYYLYNGHGDVVQIVDTNGTTVNQYQYDEWGNLTTSTEGISNSFKYAGEQFDSETGLYYLRARYYDPSMGRFINEDGYEGQIDNPLSLNLYTYVHNNPLIYADPTENWCTSANGKWSHPGDCTNSKSTYEADYLHDGDLFYSAGKEVGIYEHIEGAHEDNTWTGMVFDTIVTGGLGGIGKSLVKKMFVLRHFTDHAAEFGFTTEAQYLNGARNFLTKKATSTTKAFTSAEGTYFRYDTATNEFAIINKFGRHFNLYEASR